MDSVKKQLGENLKKLRLEKNLTQDELAEKAGLHFTYVGQIERGVRNPGVVNLYKLAKALKVTGGELLPF